MVRVNVVAKQDDNGNVKPSKERSAEKIDDYAALINAVAVFDKQAGVGVGLRGAWGDVRLMPPSRLSTLRENQRLTETCQQLLARMARADRLPIAALDSLRAGHFPR